ncbi:MAG: peptidoglycan-binding protein, partial [Sulfitobacter sp.]|nr:peptidoglycan-binding protein [Sulfitobacter sp.]
MAKAPSQPSATASQAPTVQYAQGNVREIQNMLAQLGYDPGPLDGAMGRKTATAIRSFEADRGLSPTGRPSRQIQSALTEQVQSGAVAPNRSRIVSQPSFDCARASTPTESAICSSSTLADLDRAMARAYRDALATGKSPSGTKRDQRDWIARRNACGASQVCLETTMRQRMLTLDKGSYAPSVQTAPYTTGLGTTQLGSGFEQHSAGGVLASDTAYAVLLEAYINGNPASTENREFLVYFAGLGCRAQGWERQQLNPFDRAEILDAATERLANLRTAPTINAEPMLEYTYRLSAQDYDIRRGIFPLLQGGTATDNIATQDFCHSLAKAEGVHNGGNFPMRFRPALSDGTPLDAQTLVTLLGEGIKVDRDQARAFYDRGFPNLELRLLGRAGTPAQAENGVSLVPLSLAGAEIFALGTQGKEPPLLVIGGGDFIMTAQRGKSPALTLDNLPPLTDTALINLALRADATRLQDPLFAAKYAYWASDGTCLPQSQIRGQPNEEFLRKALLEAAPELAVSKLAAQPDIDRFGVLAQGTLGTYDAQRSAFPINLRMSNGRPEEAPETFRFGLEERHYIPNCLTSDGPKLPNVHSITVRDNGAMQWLPLDRASAEQLVMANPERQILVRMELTVDHSTPDELSGGSFRLNLQSATLSDALTGDPLMQVGSEMLQAAQEPQSSWATAPDLTYPSLL